MPCSGAWRFRADRWWNLSACVDAGGQFRPIGKDAQYLVSIDGPTPEPTEAEIDFLMADAAPAPPKPATTYRTGDVSRHSAGRLHTRRVGDEHFYVCAYHLEHDQRMARIQWQELMF